MMDNSCVVNKQSVTKSIALKRAQKGTRKYYKERLFQKAVNAPKTKVGKLSDLNNVEYKVVSDVELAGDINVSLSRTELIQVCKESSLTGRSGNGFEVSRKIERLHKNNGILIINAVECDPGLVTDSWLYRNKKYYIEQGAKLLKETLGLDNVILATKEPLQDICGVQQIKVIDRFPMGYEKYLIKYVLGIEIPNDELPQDKGIIVMNLQTVIALAELKQNKMAGQYKYITVHNIYTAETKVVRVHIGDRVDMVAADCFFQNEIKNYHIYAGSGAFNCHKSSEGEIITDTTGYIAIGEMPSYEEAGKCMGCGICTRNCPAGVIVHKLIKYVDKNGINNVNKSNQFNASACIGCGACTYGCRAGKDVRKVVKWVKINLEGESDGNKDNQGPNYF